LKKTFYSNDFSCWQNIFSWKKN